MARFQMEGFDELVNELKRMGELTGETADAMLMAGAEQAKKAWKFAAAMHGIRDTGDMIDSIDYAKQPKSVAGIKQIDIYPQGKGRNGIRNAEKAFFSHYGTSRIKATHFVDDADELCDGEFSVQKAMEQEFDKLLEKE